VAGGGGGLGKNPLCGGGKVTFWNYTIDYGKVLHRPLESVRPTVEVHVIYRGGSRGGCSGCLPHLR